MLTLAEKMPTLDDPRSCPEWSELASQIRGVRDDLEWALHHNPGRLPDAIRNVTSLLDRLLASAPVDQVAVRTSV